MAEGSVVQGMYCVVKGEGTRKCTVTMTDISLTVYTTSNLFLFTEDDVKKRFSQIAQKSGSHISREKYEQDFLDLLQVTSKTRKTQMSLRSGDKIFTYTLGEPVQDEKTNFLELSPERQEWWEHPNVKPIVSSICEYLPNFKPWLLQKDTYIAILSGKSSLLR